MKLKKTCISRFVATAVAVMLLMSSTSVFASNSTGSDKYTWNESSKTMILDGIVKTDGHLNLPGGSTIKLKSGTTNKLGSIRCEGDLTIESDDSAALIIANTSCTNPYMTDHPGIIAKGVITLRNISLTDESKGNAIANISDGDFKGGVVIDHSIVEIKETGFNRNYGISSLDELKILYSTINVTSQFKVSGIDAFRNITTDHAEISINRSGIYSIVSTWYINLGRGQKIVSPVEGKVMRVDDDFKTYSWGRPIDTIVRPKSTDCEKVVITQTDGYSVTVNGNATKTETCYPGETVNIKTDLPEGKKFVKWSSDANLEFQDPESIVTSFTMIDKPVVITAEFEDDIKVSEEPKQDSKPSEVIADPVEAAKPLDKEEIADPVKEEHLASSSTASADKLEAAVQPKQASATPPAKQKVEVKSSKATSAFASSSTSTVKQNAASIPKVKKVTNTIKKKVITSVTKLDGRTIQTLTLKISGKDKCKLTSASTTMTNLEIPDTVTVGGKVYKVIGLASSSLNKAKNITTLTLGKNISTLTASNIKKCTKLKVVAVRGTSKVYSKIAKNLKKNKNVQVLRSAK